MTRTGPIGIYLKNFAGNLRFFFSYGEWPKWMWALNCYNSVNCKEEMNPWAKLTHRARRTEPKEAQKNEIRACCYHGPLDQTAPDSHTAPGLFWIHSLLSKPVCEAMFVCLSWEPPHKHRAPPPLRQWVSLSLWGSVLQHKGLLILPGSEGTPDFLHGRLRCFGVIAERNIPPYSCEPPVASRIFMSHWTVSPHLFQPNS